MESAPSKTRPIIIRIGTIVAAVIAFFVAQAATKMLFGPSDPLPIEAGDWSSFTGIDLTLETPFPLNRVDSTPILEKLKGKVTAVDLYSSEENRLFQIALQRFTYPPEVEVDLEGAVKGGLQEAAATLGLHVVPEYEVSPVVVNDVEGRRVTFYFKGRKGEVHGELLFLGDRNTLWLVQGISQKKVPQETIDRLFQSIQLHRPAEIATPELPPAP